jgi:hypothetical protein
MSKEDSRSELVSDESRNPELSSNEKLMRFHAHDHMPSSRMTSVSDYQNRLSLAYFKDIQQKVQCLISFPPKISKKKVRLRSLCRETVSIAIPTTRHPNSTMQRLLSI